MPADLMRRVRPRPDGCWLWTGYIDSDGYGRCAARSDGQVLVHRIFYIEWIGPIPQGLEIDHLCRNRACVRPAHLEAITHGENVRRGISGRVNGGRQRSKTACPKGHPYVGSNLYVSPRGDRGCRTCRREQARAYRERRVSHG